MSARRDVVYAAPYDADVATPLGKRSASYFLLRPRMTRKASRMSCKIPSAISTQQHQGACGGGSGQGFGGVPAGGGTGTGTGVYQPAPRGLKPCVSS